MKNTFHFSFFAFPHQFKSKGSIMAETSNATRSPDASREPDASRAPEAVQNPDASREPDAIRLEGITKTFGAVTANRNVSMSIRRGEILSVLGENGSGKTTLMNMISGIYFPDEGRIFVDGEEVTIASPVDAFALGIGMIHQHFKLVDVFTAAENIVLGLPPEETGKGRRLDMKAVSTG